MNVFIFLLIITTDTGSVVVKPTLTIGAAECQSLIEQERAKATPNAIAACVPHGAAIEIKDVTGEAGS